jgi:hypothetical protein
MMNWMAGQALDDVEPGLAEHPVHPRGPGHHPVGDERVQGDGEEHRDGEVGVLGPGPAHEHHRGGHGAGARQERHGQRHHRHVRPGGPLAQLALGDPGRGGLGAHHVGGGEEQHGPAGDPEGGQGHPDELEDDRPRHREAAEHAPGHHRRPPRRGPALGGGIPGGPGQEEGDGGEGVHHHEHRREGDEAELEELLHAGRPKPEKRIDQTLRRASRTMRRDIFDWPTRRSSKTMGTSSTRKLLRAAR